jgi:extradiol dioxygenase family protein
MSNPFHLAIPAGDLGVATKFYENILGCTLGNREEGKWIDVDFWGNELTLHETNSKRKA